MLDEYSTIKPRYHFHSFMSLCLLCSLTFDSSSIFLIEKSLFLQKLHLKCHLLTFLWHRACSSWDIRRYKNVKPYCHYLPMSQSIFLPRKTVFQNVSFHALPSLNPYVIRIIIIDYYYYILYFSSHAWGAFSVPRIMWHVWIFSNHLHLIILSYDHCGPKYPQILILYHYHITRILVCKTKLLDLIIPRIQTESDPSSIF